MHYIIWADQKAESLVLVALWMWGLIWKSQIFSKLHLRTLCLQMRQQQQQQPIAVLTQQQYALAAQQQQMGTSSPYIPPPPRTSIPHPPRLTGRDKHPWVSNLNVILSCLHEATNFFYLIVWLLILECKWVDLLLTYSALKHIDAVIISEVLNRDICLCFDFRNSFVILFSPWMNGN